MLKKGASGVLDPLSGSRTALYSALQAYSTEVATKAGRARGLSKRTLRRDSGQAFLNLPQKVMDDVRKKRLLTTRIVAMVICVMAGWMGFGGEYSVVGAAPLNGKETLEGQAQHITVHIENRRFSPHVIRLRVGQPTRLVLKNDDAELHAFVPSDLLVRTNVQVEGNGAPQFDKRGFNRVLLPSQGQAELTFSPREAGSFPFFCDLPGHVMNGTVVVED